MLLKDQLTQARILLNKTEKIAIPREVIKLQQLLNTQDFPDISELVNVIGQNTLLAGEVVQAANKPSMQGNNPRDIHTIRDAIDILGIRRLKNLITAIALKQGVEDFGHDQLLQHSVKVAETAAEIAKYVDSVSADEAYLLGLFHNIGAFMMTRLDPAYETVFTKSLSAPYSTTELELDTYHTTHGMVGVLVAEAWNLDTSFRKTMILHHDRNLDSIKTPELKRLVALIQLANALVSESVFQVYVTEELKQMLKTTADTLGLSEEALAAIRIGMLAS